MKIAFFSLLSLVSLLVGLSLFTDFYLLFLKPLEIGTDINKEYGDTLLVLGGGLRKGPEIGYSTEERLLQAIDLYHQKARTIIVSDGSLYPRSPAIKKMTDFLVNHGVLAKDIHLEGKSQTTFDNFFNSKEIIEELNAREVIVCTSPYHQKRAELMMRYLKIKNFKIAKMKISEIYQADSFQQRMRNIWLILREYMGIVKFKLFKK